MYETVFQINASHVSEQKHWLILIHPQTEVGTALPGKILELGKTAASNVQGLLFSRHIFFSRSVPCKTQNNTTFSFILKMVNKLLCSPLDSLDSLA